MLVFEKLHNTVSNINNFVGTHFKHISTYEVKSWFNMFKKQQDNCMKTIKYCANCTLARFILKFYQV